MPAGAGGTSDVGPAGGLGGFNLGGWDIYLGDIGNISSYGLPNFSAGYILSRIGSFIGDLDVSVGTGDLPFFQSGAGLSALDAPTGYYQDVADIEAIDRRDESPNEVNVAQVDNWFDFYELKNAGTPVIHTPSGTVWSGGVPGTPGVASTPPIVEDEGMGWISDVYGAVDEVVFGGALPGGYVAPNPVQNLGGVTGQVFAQAPVAMPGPVQAQIPPIPTGGPVIMSGSCDNNDPYKGYVWKKHCGQYRWIKQTRRRRKQLVTQTDLKGLAALKGVLGGGKAFEVWIATHS